MKKVIWNNGDVFAIKLKNDKYGIGQVLDLRWKNCVRLALFDRIIPYTLNPEIDDLCKEEVVSLIECTREQLDYGVWIILCNNPISISMDNYPNEQFRNSNWIGAKTYDAALIEDFLNGYHALSPWDDWFNPNYLDEFLIDKSKKPENLILIKP